ncbi:MAG TPA: FkbM family methyltransferase [Afifellaceae bacterium]|nr:FkbM family methyltransferase [Afifellaceae bacterium]
MNRPFLLDHLPVAVGRRLAYRLLRPVPEIYRPLYSAAELRHAPGVRMQVPKTREAMYDSIALLGIYEPELTRRVMKLARLGGHMVDVGANVGYFSLLWAAAGAGNTVLALEPSPLVLPYLERNVRANRFAGQVEIRRCAASDTQGAADFSTVCDEATGWGRLAAGSSEGTLLEVPTERLDSLVAGEERITFLKIDVEGAEAAVMQGASALLSSKRIDNIYLEVNRPGARALGHPETRALELLRAAGYTLRPLSRHGARPIEDWWATA